MRAGIHDFLFHQPGNLTLHAFGFSQIRRVAIGFFQRYDLLAIRAFRHGWSIPPQGGPSSPVPCHQCLPKTENPVLGSPSEAKRQ